MTHYDQKAYDPERLEGDEALVMSGYVYAAGEADTFFDNIDAAKTGVEALDAIYQQVAEDLRRRLADWLAVSRTELAVSLMDGNEKYREREQQ